MPARASDDRAKFARDFDLGEGFQQCQEERKLYPTSMVFQKCFNIVVREILTLGEGFNTQRRVSSFPNGQAKGQAYNCMV